MKKPKLPKVTPEHVELVGFVLAAAGAFMVSLHWSGSTLLAAGVAALVAAVCAIFVGEAGGS